MQKVGKMRIGAKEKRLINFRERFFSNRVDQFSNS